MAFADIIRDENGDLEDVADLLEGIFVSGFPAAFSTWAPTTSVDTGSYGTVTASQAIYIRIGEVVWFSVQFTGTTGSSPTQIRFTTPTTMAGALGGWGAWFADGGATKGGCAFPVSTTVIGISKYDASAFGSGSGRLVAASGVYKSA